MKGYDLPKRRLVSQEDSSVIERPDVPRSTFLGSWAHKTTFDAGLLVPILVEEVLPGDHLKYSMTAFIRMSTPVFPLMDSQRLDTHWFFVPNRLVWSNWRQMMGQQANPTDSIDFTVPIIVAGGGMTVGSTYDHMGLVVSGQFTAPYEFNALPLRGYHLIYNEWFRDQNLQNSVAVPTGDGPDTSGTYQQLLRRAKSHDYFTSCLPWPQKFTAPTVPLLGSAPIRGIGIDLNTWGPPAIGAFAVNETTGSPTYTNGFTIPSAGAALIMDSDGVNRPAIYADLSLATGVNINQMRQAWMVQTLLERDARGGTRYTELVKSHFGVTSPDARQQRPEYIGGGSTPIFSTPVAQTAPTEDTGVGVLGAATSAVGTHTASYAATEHGFIIALASIKSELTYQQGVHRMWWRRSRLDYYWPALAQLGEQAVLRREIYCTGVFGDDNTVFGYQERFHEYRTRVSTTAGLFRSTSTGNIDEWHLAQQFTSPPTLGPTFIGDNPPMSRVLAAGDLAVGQQFLADFQFNRTAVRPIPVFGTPATLGRF